MMRMTVLASGSKGNSTVIASSRTRVLVDAGLSCRELLKRMAVAGEEPEKLDAILITHEHQDHIAGLAVLARRLKIPVFFTEPTHRAWIRMLTPRTTMTYAKWLDHVQREKEARAATIAASTSTAGLAAQFAAQSEAIANISAEAAALNRSDDPNATLELPMDPDEEELCGPDTHGAGAQVSAPAAQKTDPTQLPAVEYFHAGTQFSIGDIEITPFTIPHDAADPCGFVFESEGIRMALATDLGYMPPNVKAALKRIDVLLLESNHDLEMLRDGPYPWSVKQRVLSRVGHLSNDATAEFLQKDYDGGASWIILGHLSESNNAPELARLSAERALGNHPTLLGNRILLAGQSIPLEPIAL
jgi:phosphoribosyl 1,2-cyclic phosphodiesterase